MKEEDDAATNFSSKLYRTERNDRYGPLISALFEVSPSGAPGFVTSTPKQARSAVGNLDSSQTIHDTVDKSLPRSKEKRRYEKEWTVTVPRNRRNTSLGGVNTKALPSSSSVSHTFVCRITHLRVSRSTGEVDTLVVYRYQSRTVVLGGASVSVVVFGHSGVILLWHARQTPYREKCKASETDHMRCSHNWWRVPKAYASRRLTCRQYDGFHLQPGLLGTRRPLGFHAQ